MSRSHHERVSATVGGAIFAEDVFLAGRLFAGAFLAALRAGAFLAAFLAGRLFAGAFLAVFLAGRLLAIVFPFDFIGDIYRLIMAHDRCSC
ncbi:MAG: hypothetical protein F2861_02340 [Actinobacteria bacterium]|uniref:Unannotated protein n=1 Tax=freshwater metagenome TaxID=449393 RepID=A0A6J7LT33_9ZZZZ|nr:hypothetical protein [Actinomycetota bacterium]MSV94218.1 hypothetical protein [Actinomycetota bacterium]MSW60852.1 hypothetical protein [Actinomycetota bacterium]